MSEPSDPPPSSDPDPREPLPLTIMGAIGWAFGITFAFILVRNITVTLRPGSMYDLVTEIGCQAVAYLLGLFLILRVHAPESDIPDVIGLRRTNLLFYPLALLLGAAVEIPADGLYEAITRRYPTGIEDHFIDVFREAGAPQRAVYVFLLVLVGPLLEEIIFRGALFRLMARSAPIEPVMFTTAVLFAFVHLQWQMFLPIGLVGLVLAFVRRRSGSIGPSLCVHGAFNGVSFWLMTRPGASADGPVFPLRFIAAAAAVAVLLLALVHLVGAKSAVATASRDMDLR